MTRENGLDGTLGCVCGLLSLVSVVNCDRTKIRSTALMDNVNDTSSRWGLLGSLVGGLNERVMNDEMLLIVIQPSFWWRSSID
jgi:hypothetical protein